MTIKESNEATRLRMVKYRLRKKRIDNETTEERDDRKKEERDDRKKEDLCIKIANYKSQVSYMEYFKHIEYLKTQLKAVVKPESVLEVERLTKNEASRIRMDKYRAKLKRNKKD
tara:strand:- start:763 stop:1104 length:342 start_codon:yes stop_codon:yes gene_type:complete